MGFRPSARALLSSEQKHPQAELWVLTGRWPCPSCPHPLPRPPGPAPGQMSFMWDRLLLNPTPPHRPRAPGMGPGCARAGDQEGLPERREHGASLPPWTGLRGPAGRTRGSAHHSTCPLASSPPSVSPTCPPLPPPSVRISLPTPPPHPSFLPIPTPCQPGTGGYENELCIQETVIIC